MRNCHTMVSPLKLVKSLDAGTEIAQFFKNFDSNFPTATVSSRDYSSLTFYKN